jgi:hypothetical protein
MAQIAHARDLPAVVSMPASLPDIATSGCVRSPVEVVALLEALARAD